MTRDHRLKSLCDRVCLLRLALSLIFGGALAAFANRYGLSLWLDKHRSPAGPATALDGLLTGSASGWGCAVIPPLTALIATHHLEEAKSLSFIIARPASAGVGAIPGTIIGHIGQRHIDCGGDTTGAHSR